MVGAERLHNHCSRGGRETGRRLAVHHARPDNKIVFIEILKPERLVYAHGSDKEDDPGQFHVTVTFAEQGGKTQLALRMLFASTAERDKTIEFGAVQ